MTPPNFDKVEDRRGTRSLKWSRYPQDVLPLWVADMDFPSPPPVLEALQESLNHGVFGYEAPTKKLYATVAERMHRLYGWEVSPDAIVATPGIVAGFKAAARTICQPGEGLLVQPPVYPPFLEAAPDAGAITQFAPLRRVDSGNVVQYEIDWDVFEKSLNSGNARTAMFLLCHPHNPIGKVFSREELTRMGEICLRHRVVLCSDEIHSELLLGHAAHTPAAALSPELARQSITLVSASKTFNVVGFFCGFAIIPEPALRSRYKKVLHQLALHASSQGLVAAEAALSGACDEWLAQLKSYLTANRDCLVEFVTNRLSGVRSTVPDATYLAWLDFSSAAVSQKDASAFLLKRGKVALNPGADFGPGGEGFARLNFGCPRSTLLEGLNRIERALAGGTAQDAGRP